jgi:hypothetical protein
MMENFYTHTNIHDEVEFVAHFEDIKFFMIQKRFENTIYTPYTSAGSLFSITKSEGGDEVYEQWLKYKNK